MKLFSFSAAFVSFFFFVKLVELTRPPLIYAILGVENGGINALHRNDAVTRKPLDFDQEEETRKVETSKWLEHHFGSDSRSNSTIDEHEFDQPLPPKTSFFNVTIKSQPLTSTAPDNVNTKRVYSPSPNLEPERDRLVGSSGYYKGNQHNNLNLIIC